MITKTVQVTMDVEVTVDETKFTTEFFKEYCETFYLYNTLDKHLMHIAQLKARELYGFYPHDPDEFVEGYGPIKDFGITAKIDTQDEEVMG